MDGPETSVISEEQAGIVDRDLYAFYRASFQHSQGNLLLQDALFLWTHRQGLLREFNIPEEIPDYINQHLRPPSAHKELSEGMSKGFQQGLPWSHLHAIANDTGELLHLKDSKPQKDYEKLRKTNPQDLIISIIKIMADRDLKFQNLEREGRLNPTEDDGPLDSHASQLRYFGVLGHNTGNPIFQQLYDQIRQTIVRYRNTSFPVWNFREKAKQIDLGWKLDNLARVWSLNHPGQEFFPKSP